MRSPTRHEDMDAGVRSALEQAGTATLHEAAGQIGALPSAIHSMTPGSTLVGRAYTVRGPGGDNLWIHRAIYEASPGDVLVVDVAGDYEYGYWGEILSCAAVERGLAGIVIDGCVRDSDQLNELPIPVFARGLCIRGTAKLRDGAGALGTSVQMGDVEVHTGDIVVGDVDGVVVIPADRVHDVTEASARRMAHEVSVMASLRGGARTLDLMGLT